MANLKEETLSRLSEEGYRPEDVESVQGRSLRISWERFLELADVEYDAGYGSPEVAMDLTILMKDGLWFTRGEYEGSEWWELHRHPAKVEELGDDKVSSLVCSPAQVGRCSLEEINSSPDSDEEDEDEDGR